MSTYDIDVFIHVDESLETEELATLQGALGGIAGVSDVQPSTHKHLLRVAYNPLATRAQAIVAKARQQGFNAQAVGM